MPRHVAVLSAGPALAAVLVLAGCGDDDAAPAAAGAPTTTTTADPTETSAGGSSTTAPPADEERGPTAAPAAELRAELTALLQEHVYLTGTAVTTDLRDGADAPITTSAVDTLDANSVTLSEAIAEVYGVDGGDEFLTLWRDHVDLYTEYTRASGAGDQGAADEARAGLDDFRESFGTFLEEASDGELGADTVAEGLTVHVDSVLDVVDAAVAGSPDVFGLLQVAAGHMSDLAATLAEGIAAQFPDEYGAPPA
jgi:hypothetical protein